MNDKLIKAFISTADFGSINTAANYLFISSSALLKQINTLEDEVGVLLFKRGKKGMQLTEAGEAFYRGALPLLQNYEDVLAATRLAASSSVGRVVIGTWGVPRFYILPQLTKYYNIHCPEIAITYKSILDIPSMTKALESRDIDLTIAFGGKSAVTSGLRFVSFATEAPAFLVPVNSSFATKRELSFHDLEGQTLVTTDGRVSGWFHEVNHRLKETYPTINLLEVTESESGLMNMISTGAPCLGSKSLFLNDPKFSAVPLAMDKKLVLPPISLDFVCRNEPDPNVEKLIQIGKEAAQFIC